MATPKIQFHSCKSCKYCKSKTANKSKTVKKTYYECAKDNTMITDSVYETNECLTYIPK